MADTEPLLRAALGRDAVSAALSLSSDVGWNQTAEDWLHFIDRGRTFGLFERTGALVATAAALPYDNGFGWISMVIVARRWRKRGLATRLMGECIEVLRAEGGAALLDATPAGAEVYARLGFVTVGGMERWEGEGGAASAGDGVTRLSPPDIDRLVAADREAFGARRDLLLRDFLARDGAMALGADDGFALLRPGHRATQLGPLAAPSAETAARLLDAAIDLARGPVFLDLLDGWHGLTPLLEARGFRRQRPFRRMALGRSTLPGDPRRLVCAAGPEFG
jgi:GNAT superfamily N-acetyltransferase